LSNDDRIGPGGDEQSLEPAGKNAEAQLPSGSGQVSDMQTGYRFSDVQSSLCRSEEERQLAAVMEIANVINSRLELEHILPAISQQLSRVIDYDIGCVAIYEKDENCLYIRHVIRKSGDSSGEDRYVPLDESNLIGWVAINKRPILRTNIPSDMRFTEIMKEDNLMSDIVVPLITKDQLIGTVNIGRYRKEQPFSEFDLELVKKFSQLTTIAIENSQLFRNIEDLGEKYRKLMNNATDLILLINFSGEIVECNKATYDLFGYAPEEVIGKDFFLFTLPNRREMAKKSFYKILQGEVSRALEVPYLMKKGEVVYLEINASLMKVKGNPYVLVIAHDVTERKKLQEKITIQNRELKSINQKLRELDQLKSEFLSRISHELRTPLSIIMAYSGTLLEDNGDHITEDMRTEFLNVIENQSDKLLGLINDLLDLSKVEISETMLDVTPGSISEMINISVKLVEPFARQHNIEIKADLDHEIPIIHFDALRFRQVCVNLLNNAVKFSEGGGSVTIRSQQTEKEVIVSVIDNGPGIEKEYIPTIFDNFTQINGGLARPSNGMGIGLKLVKHYVGLHHGRVWVESEKGKGSTFFFTLPKKLTKKEEVEEEALLDS
jgi:PAS domain S-box-containing protein